MNNYQSKSFKGIERLLENPINDEPPISHHRCQKAQLPITVGPKEVDGPQLRDQAGPKWPMT
jgi:hypothetical protein